jgi:hypothetical protein
LGLASLLGPFLQGSRPGLAQEGLGDWAFIFFASFRAGGLKKKPDDDWKIVFQPIFNPKHLENIKNRDKLIHGLGKKTTPKTKINQKSKFKLSSYMSFQELSRQKKKNT